MLGLSAHSANVIYFVAVYFSLEFYKSTKLIEKQQQTVQKD